MKQTIKLNESQLRKVVAESIRKILGEDAISEKIDYPDYSTLFEKTKKDNSFTRQLAKVVSDTHDMNTIQNFREYMFGFYKWTAENKIMYYDHTGYIDDTYFIIAFDFSFNHGLNGVFLKTFEICGNKLFFETLSQRCNGSEFENYYLSPREAFPRLCPVAHVSQIYDIITNKISEDVFWEIIDNKENGTYNFETKQFED